MCYLDRGRGLFWGWGAGISLGRWGLKGSRVAGQSGARRLGKRWGGPFWRIRIGWRIVGDGQRQRALSNGPLDYRALACLSAVNNRIRSPFCSRACPFFLPPGLTASLPPHSAADSSIPDISFAPKRMTALRSTHTFTRASVAEQRAAPNPHRLAAARQSAGAPS